MAGWQLNPLSCGEGGEGEESAFDLHDGSISIFSRHFVPVSHIPFKLTLQIAVAADRLGFLNCGYDAQAWTSTYQDEKVGQGFGYSAYPSLVSQCFQLPSGGKDVDQAHAAVVTPTPNATGGMESRPSWCWFVRTFWFKVRSFPCT